MSTLLGEIGRLALTYRSDIGDLAFDLGVSPAS